MRDSSQIKTALLFLPCSEQPKRGITRTPIKMNVLNNLLKTGIEEFTMKTIAISVALTTALLSTSVAFSDSWDVTQATIINGAGVTIVDQHAGTTNSLQGINVINTAASVTGSQNVTTSGLTLKQTDTVSASTQAANYAKAGSLGSAADLFIQNLTANGLTLDQSSSGSHIIQGGNIIDESATDINADQRITENATLTMTQTGTNNALQVGNGVLTGTSTSGSTTNLIVQNVVAGGLDMDQNGVSNSTQAANYVGPAQ